MSTENKPLEPADVATMFAVSKRTVLRWVQDGVWVQYGVQPWHTPGGEVRFDSVEIQAAIDRAKGKAVSLRAELLSRATTARARCITIANQKGGVGKTCLSVNLAVALAKGGDRVCLVDCDPQGNATQHLGYGDPPGTRPLEHRLAEIWRLDPDQRPLSMRDVLVPTRYDGVLLAPMDVEGLRVEHATTVLNLRLANSEYKPDVRGLNRVLADFYGTLPRQVDALLAAEPFDYVIFDTSPTLGPLTTAALMTSDGYLVPVEPEAFGAYGVQVFEELVSDIMGLMDRKAQCLGYVINHRMRNAQLRQGVAEHIRSVAADRVLRTEIPENVAIGEAAARGLSVLEHAPTSRAAEAFRALAAEVTERVRSADEGKSAVG